MNIWCNIKYVNSSVLWTLTHLKFLNADKLLHPFSSIWVCNIDPGNALYECRLFTWSPHFTCLDGNGTHDCHCYQFVTNMFHLVGLIIRSQILLYYITIIYYYYYYYILLLLLIYFIILLLLYYVYTIAVVIIDNIYTKD